MVASSNSFYYQSKGWNITARVGTSGGGVAWPKSIDAGKTGTSAGVWEIVRKLVRGMCPKI